jgi:hypothetical protein
MHGLHPLLPSDLKVLLRKANKSKKSACFSIAGRYPDNS